MAKAVSRVFLKWTRRSDPRACAGGRPAVHCGPAQPPGRRGARWRGRGAARRAGGRHRRTLQDLVGFSGSLAYLTIVPVPSLTLCAQATGKRAGGRGRISNSAGSGGRGQRCVPRACASGEKQARRACEKNNARRTRTASPRPAAPQEALRGPHSWDCKCFTGAALTGRDGGRRNLLCQAATPLRCADTQAPGWEKLHYPHRHRGMLRRAPLGYPDPPQTPPRAQAPTPHPTPTPPTRAPPQQRPTPARPACAAAAPAAAAPAAPRWSAAARCAPAPPSAP
jgi:hypothetical protein